VTGTCDVIDDHVTRVHWGWLLCSPWSSPSPQTSSPSPAQHHCSRCGYCTLRIGLISPRWSPFMTDVERC